eukprot:Lithocolla_globosa_v1_NODE_1481_length_2542_cov_69.368717.p3 type:complete len:111 gc:universal NODE_1481_length_2542_cov_69.368717:250-582(+)
MRGPQVPPPPQVALFSKPVIPRNQCLFPPLLFLLPLIPLVLHPRLFVLLAPHLHPHLHRPLAPHLHLHLHRLLRRNRNKQRLQLHFMSQPSFLPKNPLLHFQKKMSHQKR